MTPEQLALVVFGVGIVVVLAVIFFHAIPAMARLSALYKVHNVRDRLFVLGMEKTEYRRTLLYRDLDALLAGAIQILREGSREEAAAFFLTMETASKQKGQSIGWRARQIKGELESVYADARDSELEFLSSINQETQMAMAFRVAGSRPLYQVVVALYIFRRLLGAMSTSLMTKTALEPQQVDAAMAQFSHPVQTVERKQLWHTAKRLAV